MTKGITTTGGRLTIRWTDDDGFFFATDDKRLVEVFESPDKPGKFCWRRYRMNGYWRHQDGGIADTTEDAMTAASVSLAGGKKVRARAVEGE